MLQKIHERVQGFIAWTLIILIALTFTLWGINYYLESHGASDVQADVNGEKISKVDFSNSYQRLKRESEQQRGELSVKQQKLLKNRALKQLIFTRVVLQGAKSAGYLVTREQAEQALMQIPQFQEDGQFSAEKFQQALSSALYTPSVFLKKIQEGLLINQQRFSFAGTTFILPEEMNQFIALAKQTRNVSYLIIPEKIFEADMPVSSEELHHYYNKNKSQFKMPEKVSIDYVEISMKKILSETEISDSSIETYYQDNIDAYTHPAQWQWSHILVRIPVNMKYTPILANRVAHKKALKIEKSLRQGEAFSVAAKKNSEDVFSSGKGGIMPWVSELSVSTEILNVLQTLKDGEISAPIKTEYGYEIIQRTGYRPPEKIPFKEVKKSIKEILKTDKAQQVFAELGDNLTNLSYQDPLSLTQTAKTLDLSIKTSPFFTRKGLSKGIASNKAIVQAAFSDEVLKDKNNSTMIAIGDNLLVVLRINKYLPPAFMSFNSVQEILKQQIIKEKASIKAREYGEKLLSDLKNKPDSSFLKEEPKYHLTWETKIKVERDDTELDPVILSTLFKMSPLMDKKRSFQGTVLDNGNYAILKLTKIKSGSVESLDQEERKMFKDEIEAAFGIIDYNLYVDGLMHQAKIVERSQ